ncbi:MAG: PKD domain-containing protein [Acidimicrobiales bacterium]
MSTTPVVFASGLGALVDLNFGPDGNMYAVDIAGERVLQIVETGGNQSPVARFTATPTSGPAPLTVQFNASTSSDPNAGDVLSYAWDFDGNGTTDATGVTASHVYASNGAYTASLKVTDQGGLANGTSRTIQVGNAAFTVSVTEPADGRTFRVGAAVPLRATATYADGTAVPASAFTWALNIEHCVPNAPDSCHLHDLTEIEGNRTYFVMPDHEYPSSVEATLTVAPAGAVPVVIAVPIAYRVVDLDIETVPAGLVVNVGSAEEPAPFTRPIAMEATTDASVAATQTLNGRTYQFQKWQQDGVDLSSAQAVEIAASADTKLTAIFALVGGVPDTEAPSTPRGLKADAGLNGIVLTWTGSTDNVGVAGYQIFRSTNGSLGSLYRTTSGVGTSFTDQNVSRGVTYTYAVKAIDAADNTSSRTNLATEVAESGAPDTEAPSTPRGLKADAGLNGIVLTWTGSTDNVGVAGYQIFRSTNGSLGSLYRTTSGVGTSFPIVNATGVTYVCGEGD